MSNLVIVSADCHAGAQPETYREYLPAKLREPYDEWWAALEAEMAARRGTFFDQDAQEKRDSDESVLAGGINGEWDAEVRLRELEADGIVGEVIFPQMAPFGGGLLQYRTEIDPAQNLEGNRAYNRWLADLCNANPGRHAGVALITVEDIEVAIHDVEEAQKNGLWGGVLIPSGTGDNPYYHDPRYEPLWDACEALQMPIHTHSGWSPDYGDGPAATAMFISEVSWYAHRPFTCFVWAGVFERHPNLKLVMTEQGCTWILETLRQFERYYSQPYFKYFHKDLSMRPSEYFERQCYIGASFLNPEDCQDRHKIGVDKIMWGSDYPHLEGTWPDTRPSLQATFGEVSEAETRAMLGGNAAEVFGFDAEVLAQAAERVGPKLGDIVKAA
ncbi:amidohydrolase family protein [Myxococcota bacterium]|nr:amidohydrolase family protein [Myxococcota bacterium]